MGAGRSAAGAGRDAAAGLAGFLEVCERPEVVQIALTDAPAVPGWRTWREIESRHGLGLITDTLERVAAQQRTNLGAAVPVLAQLALSAVVEAAHVSGRARPGWAATIAAYQS